MIRKRIFSNIIWMLLERVIVTLVAFTSNIYVVRTLGASNFGELAYLQAILNLLVVGAEFGLRRVLMVSLGKAGSGMIVSATLLLKTVVAILLAGVCYAAFLSSGEEGYVALVLFCVFAPLDVYTYVMQTELRNDLLAKARTILALMGAGVRIWLCIVEMGSINALLLTYVVQFALIYFAAWVWKSADDNREWHVSFRRFSRVLHLSKIIFSRSIFYFFSMLIIQAHYRIDQIMISKIAGNAELGIYSSAYKLVEQLLMIPGIISAVLLPQMALNRKSRELTRNRLSMIYGVTILASVGMAIPFMLMADPLVRLAFGAEFSAAGNVLFYLMLGVPFLFLANVSGLYFSVLGNERHAVLRNLSGLAVNVTFNMFMIPRFGATGAALSTVISYFMVAIGTELIFWKRFREHLGVKWVAARNLFRIAFYRELICVLHSR